MSLKIYIGPMFSGKTTKIMKIYNKYIQKNMNIIVINHSLDTNHYNNIMINHNNHQIQCIYKNFLADVTENEIKDIDIILVNEGQFFSDLYTHVKKWVDVMEKKVYVCGLDGDFNREKFGEILNLIPIADKVVKFNANCNSCNNKAPFTIRLTKETTQILVGSDKYKPVCRKCYISETNNYTQKN